jgi:hypothetical protein
MMGKKTCLFAFLFAIIVSAALIAHHHSRVMQIDGPVALRTDRDIVARFASKFNVEAYGHAEVKVDGTELIIQNKSGPGSGFFFRFTNRDADNAQLSILGNIIRGSPTLRVIHGSGPPAWGPLQKELSQLPSKKKNP